MNVKKEKRLEAQTVSLLILTAISFTTGLVEISEGRNPFPWVLMGGLLAFLTMGTTELLARRTHEPED